MDSAIETVIEEPLPGSTPLLSTSWMRVGGAGQIDREHR